MDDFITVSAGGPSAETDVPDGVYILTLVDIKEPRQITVTRGERAGQQMDLRDWVFAVEAPGTAFHERTIDSSTSTASGPKSKQYAYLTALNGGIAPTVGQKFGKGDLVGRQALGTIAHDEGGWPQIANLSAIPASMRGQAAPNGGQPAAAAAAAAGQANADGMPF